MVPTITSPQNSKLKSAAKLRDRRMRDKSLTFLLEGAREIGLALTAGFQPLEVFYCPQRLSVLAKELLQGFLDKPSVSRAIVSEAAFEKLALRDQDGLVVIFRQQNPSFDEFAVKKMEFLMVIDSVEKPGNLGALLRTADAAGVDAVLLTDPIVDLYNPNVLRASLGAAFTLPVIKCNATDVVSYCQRHSIQLVCASLDATSYYDALDMTRAVAVVVGSEANGLGSSWYECGAEVIKVPMLGKVDSLNVSVAGGILLYEVVRQRRTNAAQRRESDHL